MNLFLILFGKIFVFLSSFLNLGSGSTWPGHIAIKNDKNFIKKILTKNQKLKVILIAGTNGKTTTGKLIQTILEKNGERVFQNDSGANLINGVASSIIKNSSVFGKLNYDFAVFEIDENSMPLVLDSIDSETIILLNLFRDQLDRYGEVNIVANKWKKALSMIDKKTILILNADDPKIAYLGNGIRNKVKYFGVRGVSQEIDHASDSGYCPKCGNKLDYKFVTFSHLGDWICKNCELKKPKTDIENFEMYPLSGIYNKYNTHAAVLTARILGFPDYKIARALKDFKPAFGRQEIIEYKNKKIQIFLSKNPASFNQSLATINDLKARNLLIVLNDRIPDGRDVSWIWDIDFESNLKNFKNISVSGDRVYDIALRLQYTNNESRITNHGIKVYEKPIEAVDSSLKNIRPKEILYILPTYSAMLDLRKILTGKAIL